MDKKVSVITALCALSFLFLFVLKLTNEISYLWIWVFAPLWVPIMSIISFVILFLIFAVIVALILYS